MNDPPVKFFCAVLHSEKSGEWKSVLREYFGPDDYESAAVPFDGTDYYRPEMGENLYRSILSFARPAGAGDLVRLKQLTNRLETERFSDAERRRVNLDPGYVDFMKVILASNKGAPHKIYLSEGIYADLTLLYGKGGFTCFPWTFPDFKSGVYHRDLLEIRRLYKLSLKNPKEEYHGQILSAGPERLQRRPGRPDPAAAETAAGIRIHLP